MGRNQRVLETWDFYIEDLRGVLNFVHYQITNKSGNIHSNDEIS